MRGGGCLHGSGVPCSVGHRRVSHRVSSNSASLRSTATAALREQSQGYWRLLILVETWPWLGGSTVGHCWAQWTRYGPVMYPASTPR